MKNPPLGSGHELLNAQQQHWEQTFSNHPDMYGLEPSEAARQAAERFSQFGITTILELGAGQGRDTLFFAQRGFHVCALDYSQQGIKDIPHKADTLGVSKHVTAMCHDVRTPLPFDDASFGGCYSHMLYCMALTIADF